MIHARRIACAFMRGGTSRGAFFLDSDLPADSTLRDAVVLSVYGSPDPRQINGVGGGDPLTSKVAVVAPSQRTDADVDYTFGQVGIDTPNVFWVGNCGNMSSAVGPFAILRGLVPAVSPTTHVRIFNTNTNKVLVAHVPIEDGTVVEEGDIAIAGVPGTGAAILLDFGECGGAVTGATLPTDAPSQGLTLTDGSTVEASIVDAGAPFVFVRAADVGITGTELPTQIDADTALLQRLEDIRAHAAVAIGLVQPGQVAREVSPSIPRVVAVSAPATYTASDGRTVNADDTTILVRQLSMQRSHKTYSVTGAICTGVAAAIPGTIVNQLARPNNDHLIHLGHPGGIMTARTSVQLTNNSVAIHEASLLRTAHLIMDGHVHVPASLWPN